MKTVDTETITRFMNMLEDIPDEELVDVIRESDAEWRRVKDVYERASFEIRKRLEANGEGRRPLPNGAVIELEKPANGYEWDMAVLPQIQPHLAPGEYDRLVWEEQTVTTKVNTRALLALAERQGGKLKEIVDSAYTKKPRGDIKVTIKFPKENTDNGVRDLFPQRSLPGGGRSDRGG